jgi:hypothetical protein
MKKQIHEIEHGPFVIEYTYTPGSPAKLSGHPEDCYPAEPSCFLAQKSTWGENQDAIDELFGGVLQRDRDDGSIPTEGAVPSWIFNQWFNHNEEHLRKAIDKAQEDNV